jgi:long-chain acyl-CoA synthetase
MTEGMEPLEVRARKALAGDPEGVVLEFEGQPYRWAFLSSIAGAVIRLLDEAGVDPRDPIGFIPRNTPSSVAATLGLIAHERTIRMIYAFQRPAGIARDVGRLKLTGVVITARDASDEVLAVAREQGIAVVVIDEAQGARYAPGCERSTASPDPDRPATPEFHMLTSGTTGPPKHVGLGFPVIARTIMQNKFAAGMQEGAQAPPPAILALPFSNIAGLIGMLPPVLGGHQALLREKFDLAFWRDYVVRYRPEHSGMPVPGFRMALDADIPPEDLASLKSLTTGSALLDPTVQRAFEEKYGVPIFQSYGATEFGGPVTLMTLELYRQYGKSKSGSAGRPLDGVQLRVIDPDTGQPLPPGTEGMLEVVSPRVGPDWIRTADIAVIDEDGFLFYRGRADGAIVRGGFKILPETIEQALLTHPKVAEAAVVGISDHRLGQTPAAAVRPAPDAEPPTIVELEAHLRDLVLATHIPTQWRIVSVLPRTPSFKLDQAAVRSLFATDA